MNDKYISQVDEFSDVVDGILDRAAIQTREAVEASPLWPRFCIIARSGVQFEGERENKVLDWAREYNQGNQGTVDVRIT